MRNLPGSSLARREWVHSSCLATSTWPSLYMLGCGLFALFLLVLAGCDSNPRRVPVSGLVTYQGAPLRWGVIQLDPIDGGPPGLGEIQSDGTFRVTTFRKFDGAIPGTYRVSFVVFPFDGHPAVYGRNQKGRKTKSDFLPVKYTDPQRSGLQVVVNDRDNHLELHLTE